MWSKQTTFDLRRCRGFSVGSCPKKGTMRAGNLVLRDWEKPWDPFFERCANFSGRKGNFAIKTCYIAAQFLAHKPVNIASFTKCCIVLHILKITETSILNANTTKTKQLSGPEKLPGLSGNRPLGTRLECRSMAHGQRMVYQAQYYLKHSWGPYTRRDVFSS